MELLERFRSRYPFPLDDFQVEAIRAIEAGQSVIVSAPTGAGKTLVAEFAIQQALAHGTRLAYTTPLKALSNQKFGDFQRAYGEDKVGILTGDVKVNPQADILVMTTEILRNALRERPRRAALHRARRVSLHGRRGAAPSGKRSSSQRRPTSCSSASRRPSPT
jgi:superfamily II RNA helicase